MIVYLLMHEWESEDGCEHIKLIGVYSTEELAQAAIERLREQPGFKDYPEGFHIGKNKVDRTNWREGFVTKYF